METRQPRHRLPLWESPPPPDPPEETSSLWLIHYIAACLVPSWSTAEADKASFTALTLTQALSQLASLSLLLPHSIRILVASFSLYAHELLWAFQPQTAGTLSARPTDSEGNPKGSDNRVIWACSVLAIVDFLFQLQIRWQKNRRRLICQPTWGAVKL